jgi:hypothetical protein
MGHSSNPGCVFYASQALLAATSFGLELNSDDRIKNHLYAQ